VTDPASGPGRVGVFGSAFNPPHTGHLVLAAEARWRLGLDLVAVVPTGEAYHKRSDIDPGSETRYELAEAAFREEGACDVLRLEVDRPGPSLTVDTLTELTGQFPGAELFLLLGADAALGLADWQSPGEVLELATVVVAPRPGIDPAEVERACSALGAPEKVEMIEMPRIDITSTVIRGRVERGEPFRHLVPQLVAEMITERGLYGV
jgi:nicotinate-nucleotide adenylyltransferase